MKYFDGFYPIAAQGLNVSRIINTITKYSCQFMKKIRMCLSVIILILKLFCNSSPSLIGHNNRMTGFGQRHNKKPPR